MSTPPPPSPPASPTAGFAATPIATKKPQPIPWTHEETEQLIRAYQEKWYELRRGQLKSSQWEEVAVTVAARCGYDYLEPSKTAIQCRHKMEKLRQRYRAVKKRLRPGARSGWPFFELMESMERGSMPISARLPCQQQLDEQEEGYHNYHGGDVAEIDDDDDDENYSTKVRSIDYILRRPVAVNRFSGGKATLLQDSAAGKRSREAVFDGGDNGGNVGEEPLPTKMGEMVVGLADEIRVFAKRLNGVESRRREIMKETERCRSEMEKRRIDMIQESQQKIVESIERAFGCSTNNICLLLMLFLALPYSLVAAAATPPVVYPKGVWWLLAHFEHHRSQLEADGGVGCTSSNCHGSGYGLGGYFPNTVAWASKTRSGQSPSS